MAGVAFGICVFSSACQLVFMNKAPSADLSSVLLHAMNGLGAAAAAGFILFRKLGATQ
jgi:hypothetical protein